MTFRSSRYCKRYEYTSVDLQNSIQMPGVNQLQQKSGYRFVLDSTSEPNPFDLYNSYISIDFKLTKMDNTGYADNDQVSIINGGHSLIEQIKVDINGLNVLDTPSLNHATNIKNITEFSASYTKDFGPSMFNYPDTNTGIANSIKYTLREVQHGRNDANNAYEARNFLDGVNADYNEGFAKRKSLLTGGTVNNINLPLNRYSFFNSFENQICPNSKLSIEIIFENDNNLIFRAGGDPGRVIITRMVLYVPKMIFNAEGESLFLNSFLKPHTWSYLKERIEKSAPLTLRQNTFRITSAIKKPRHVFIWVINEAKLNSQTHNMLAFNTFNIANNRNFSYARLELSNGTYYPTQAMNPGVEIVQAYRTLMEYQKDNNSYFTSPTITLESFKNLYGILYFDLRHQEEGLKNETTQLSFHYTLDGVPNANYTIYSLILHEEDISVDIVNNKAILKA